MWRPSTSVAVVVILILTSTAKSGFTTKVVPASPEKEIITSAHNIVTN